MSIINNNGVISIIEWTGVASSLTGSVLNACGRRCSFIFWTLSALLLGLVALHLGRPGWLALQCIGIIINLYGMRNWQGNAPTRVSVHDINQSAITVIRQDADISTTRVAVVECN